MPTLLLAFANSDDPDKHLQTLTDEYTDVKDTLRDREKKGDFTVIREQMATRTQVYNEIRGRELDIHLFLFSGHAGRDQLQLEDGVGNAPGIAAILSKCPNLKVVILNGCSTAGQVDLLLKLNIPIVIGTSSNVDDRTATQFSIALFRELSQHYLPIGKAFERAISVAQFYGKIPEADQLNKSYVDDKKNDGEWFHKVSGFRGLDIGQEDKDKPLWGLYYVEKDAALLNTWRLPIKVEGYVESKIKINDILRRALAQIAEDNFIDSATTLDRLPYMIHLPIRKLLAVETSESAPFYDKPSEERFQMLLYTYRSIINLTTYVLLAEAWEQSLRKPTIWKLPDKCLDLIQRTLFNENDSDKQQSNLALLRALGQEILSDQENKFMNRFAPLISVLGEDEPQQALDDLERKIKDQADNPIDSFSNSEKLAVCLETENSLAVVLVVFGFWVSYSLTSVKDIGLLKSHRLRERTFMHRVVPLQYGYVSPKSDDEQFQIPIPLETTSVILHPYGRDKWMAGGLNLSPFLIDRNAFLKTPRADLYYLLSFSTKKNDTFFYRDIKSYEKSWEILPNRKQSKYIFDKDGVDDSNHHILLKKQLIAFTQTVLHKSLDEL